MEVRRRSFASIPSSTPVRSGPIAGEDKNIDLVVEVDRNLPSVYQDQAKVQQILTNLLSNAIKFTPEAGASMCSPDMIVVANCC